MGKRIIFNGFTQCCMNHHSEGLWKHPQDGSSRGYTSTDYWVDLTEGEKALDLASFPTNVVFLNSFKTS